MRKNLMTTSKLPKMKLTLSLVPKIWYSLRITEETKMVCSKTIKTSSRWETRLTTRNKNIKKCSTRSLKSYLMKTSLPKQHKPLLNTVRKMPLLAGNSTKMKLFPDGIKEESLINHLMSVRNSVKRKHLSNASQSITQKLVISVIFPPRSSAILVSEDIQVHYMITLRWLEMKDLRTPNYPLRLWVEWLKLTWNATPIDTLMSAAWTLDYITNKLAMNKVVFKPVHQTLLQSKSKLILTDIQTCNTLSEDGVAWQSTKLMTTCLIMDSKKRDQPNQTMAFHFSALTKKPQHANVQELFGSVWKTDLIMAKEFQLGKNSGLLKLSLRQIQNRLFNAARENSASTSQSTLISRPNAGVRDILPIFQTYALMRMTTASVTEESSSDKSMPKVIPVEKKSIQSNQ